MRETGGVRKRGSVFRKKITQSANDIPIRNLLSFRPVLASYSAVGVALFVIFRAA